jgi:surfeit locus 1 family protein
MKRWPLIPTIVVALAVATMIGLGLWQLLDRRPAKNAYLEQLARNPAKPAITFPRVSDDRLLFRRASADCVPPIALTLVGAGSFGFRILAECGNGIPVQLGTTRDPKARIAWTGGTVTGFVSHAPDGRSVIGSLFDDSPKRMMLVLDRPPLGLSANPAPDTSAVPNSHLAYAGQWFFFALSAAVIYLLALRRRPATAPM